MSATPGPDPRRARVRKWAGVALVIALGSAGIAVLSAVLSPRGGSTVIAPTAPPADPGVRVDATVIYVHILGQVVRPGLYGLSEGDRAVDAVAAAGGFTAEADPAGLNLARFLSDGEQIIVPAVGETVAYAPGMSQGKVNINTADAATLDTLPGIGPATAAKIVAWREQNGRFASVEDLLAVSGIGDAKLDGFRDLVTI